MQVWYKVDSRRLSWGQLWSASSSVLVFLLAAVLIKLLRFSPPPVVGFTLNPTLQPVELDELPSKVQKALRAIIDECGKHSFHLAYCFSRENLGDAESYLASLLHDGGRIRATAAWERMVKHIWCGCTFTTRLENGDIYSTTNLPRGVDSPPGIHVFSYPGASIEEMFSRHQQLLEQFGEAAAVALSPEQLPEELKEQIGRVHANRLARGELKPLTEAEVERLTIVTAELVPEPGDNPFQSPLTDEVPTAPRPPSLWRMVLNGACIGFALGAIVGLAFASEPKPPPNATLWGRWLAILRLLGWQPLPALVGAFFGWLSWRRAKQRAATLTSSN